MSLSLFFSKSAEDAPEVAALQDHSQNEAWKAVGNTALAGLGVGAGGMGLYHLKNWLSRPQPISPEFSLGPNEVDLPYPQFEGADATPAEARELKRRKMILEREKAAEGTDYLGMLTKFLGGGDHMTPSAKPWFLPAVTAAGVGGVAGGAGLVNWLAERRRKADQGNELDDSKQEFEDAMMGQYSPQGTHRLLAPKQASLDCLYERCMAKGADLNNAAGSATGAYLTLAGLLAAGSGYGTYQYMQGRSKARQLEKAVKDRAALRATNSPPEMFIHPVAVNRPRPLPAEAEAAENPSPA